ncbi:hypothetical protein CKM354_000794900 [Cercospora kikuchii]|uniref:Uncharacterized protein n=1 Tax=Cercospora kikuchii TaxID=84275 RepID=A0A9P3FJ51_9PEZI|nr:uncharacterized protein CKM354_000794900 [Cercospora kikuchii]GIZ44759.1 hypothetical protein CKM354_000794900 [Cercospora kikuchii]
MGRGGPKYLSYTALVLLSRAIGISAGLWDVDIDLSPAPPAESGPPFSAHASRNRDLLPYQIIGVVGAYVGSVIILGTLLLTVGRRLRTQAQMMSEKPVEMVKPPNKQFDPSPLSPSGSARGWFGRKTRSVRSGRSNIGSPGLHSVASFDQTVVDRDKQRRDEELAQIYGQVLEYDDARAHRGGNEYPSGAPPAYGRDRPTLPALKRVQSTEPAPLSPLSPRSPTSPYYAVAPPKDLLAQLSPRYKSDEPKSPGRDVRNTPSASFVGGKTSLSSPGKLRKNLGRLKISAPMQGIQDNEDGARTPLSPKIYSNPGPPPEPPSARTAETYPYTPTTPGTAVSYPFPEEEDFEDIRDLPPAHPQRQRGFTNDSQTPRSPASPGLPSSPAQFRVGSPPRRGNTPASNVDRPLALRQFAEQQKQMQQSQVSLASPTARQFPLSPAGAWNTRPVYPGGLLSPAIQQTVLQTRNAQEGPTTAGGTRMPYSPYFPGQMVTPVSARFTTRAERKQKEKEEKAIRGAITEEDQVPDEEDLWRDGYR